VRGAWTILSLLLLLTGAARAEEAERTATWRQDGELADVFEALTADDAFTRTEHGGHWSEEYSAAKGRLPAFLARYSGDFTFMQELARVLGKADHDKWLGQEVVNDLTDDVTRLALVRALGIDVEAPFALRTMSRALNVLDDRTHPDIPGSVLPVLEGLLGKPDDCPECGNNGQWLPGSFRQAALPILEEHFPAEPRFVAWLWRWVAEPADDVWMTGERCRRLRPLLGAYRGPGALAHQRAALADPSPSVRSLAAAVVLEQGGDELIGPAADALRDLLTADPRPPALVGKPLEGLEQFARRDPRGSAALVEAWTGGTDYRIGQVLRELLHERPDLLDAAGWRPLLERLVSADPSCQGAADIAARADMSPVVVEVRGLLERSSEELPTACLAKAVAGQPTTVLEVLLTDIADLPEASRWALVRALPGRHRDPGWELLLVPLLEDERRPLARATFRLLHGSSIPEVRDALREYAAGDSQAVDPYQAVLHGLLARWTVPASNLDEGDPLEATLVLHNHGFAPVGATPTLFTHRVAWYVAAGDAMLGPIPVEADSAVPAGGELSVAVQLGDVIAALGSGEHTLQLVLVVRPVQLHFARQPGFRRATDAVTVTVAGRPDRASTREGLAARINSPDPEVRAAAWASWSPADPAEPLELLERLAAGHLDELSFFQLRVGSSGIRTETWRIERARDGTLQFVRSWDEEDIGGRSSSPVSRSEAQAFFRLLRDGSPFEHRPVQTLGGLYEGRAVIDLVGRTEPPTLAGPRAVLWMDEVRHHPRLKRWLATLERWTRRAAP